MQTTEQTDLAARLLHDDESVLEDILRTLGPSILSVLRSRYVGVLDHADLEDVLSAALFRLWCSRERFDPQKGKLNVWFFRIADNTARDVLRRGWQKARQLERGPDPELAGSMVVNGTSSRPAPTTTNHTPLSPLQSDLKEILDQLPDKQRRILLADAASRDDVASSQWLSEQLNIPPSTVRVYRKRALDRVRRELEKRGHSPPSP